MKISQSLPLLPISHRGQSNQNQLVPFDSKPASTSLEAQQQPLALAYQAAIDRINEAVAPYLGEGAIERGLAEEVDVSPEATASRIVSFSTGLLNRYEARSEVANSDERINRFVSAITTGLERGFAEAREILDGLGVLEGEVEAKINATYDLVVAGIEKFRLSRLA